MNSEAWVFWCLRCLVCELSNSFLVLIHRLDLIWFYAQWSLKHDKIDDQSVLNVSVDVSIALLHTPECIMALLVISSVTVWMML